MCNQGEVVWMPELGPHGRYIDKCMKKRIRALMQIGIETLGCCCGHGKYPETIIVNGTLSKLDDRVKSLIDCIFEWNTLKEIPRTRNFYKKDDDGIYYIPEVVNE
ncbi:MAG: hypothetical protein DRP09_10550 [Candidatus Thorarchaeota archaeon]|nr:MAG: hypothetical protein DRP09_10550 [Candidatus Thorarchaeota archaeon]